MRISLVFIGFLVLLLSGCSEDRFYSDLHAINLKVEHAKELFGAETYNDVLESLQGLDTKILALADKYPDKQSELMPEFQLAIVYSLLSQSNQNLGNHEQSRRFRDLFYEQVNKIGIKDTKSVTVGDFISRFLEGESIDSSID